MSRLPIALGRVLSIGAVSALSFLPSVTPLANAQSGGAQAAVAQVAQQGYTPNDTSDYQNPFALHVLIGTATVSGDGYNQRAFFFYGGNYLGTDAADPSAGIQEAWRDDTTIALTYALYGSNDPMCCPTGGGATVRFLWNGSGLQPLDPIPPSSGNGLSRY